MGALVHLWDAVGSTVSSLGRGCIKIYSISADLFAESWGNAFQEYVVDGSRQVSFEGFIYLLEAIFTEWELYGW